MSISIAGLIFLLVSIVFLGLVLRDFWTHRRCLTVQARIWLRLAMIFGIVAVLLLFV
ncbi:hypothetical protein [Methylotuvimicrobium sp. KM1]|uniref:hypothetical protein n=1 Tax=Methylotuvimicrobium sp. KM1 TaxID=3377707 RepID=UPI00384DD5FB